MARHEDLFAAVDARFVKVAVKAGVLDFVAGTTERVGNDDILRAPMLVNVD